MMSTCLLRMSALCLVSNILDVSPRVLVSQVVEHVFEVPKTASRARKFQPTEEQIIDVPVFPADF